MIKENGANERANPAILLVVVAIHFWFCVYMAIVIHISRIRCFPEW